ncbi:MAG: site-specific DNA-methyltransferase [Parvibaculaceae bacterium]
MIVKRTKTANQKIFRDGAPSTLFLGDCMELIKSLPDESVDLVITSPPYFMGKEYDRSYNISDFQSDHEKLAPEIARVVKQGGHICWQTGFHVRNGSVIPLDALVYAAFSKQSDFVLRNRIIWTFGHGAHCQTRFSGRHETILWFSKGNDYRFNLDAIRVPQKYPGKRHYRGPKKGEFSGNPEGKNPGDVWDIPNVKANHIEKTSHPCQFPVALVQRLVKALSMKNELVLDPYAGTASCGVAALLENRRFIGAEISAEYAQIGKKRLNETLKGKIQHRPLERPVHKPDGNEAVAQKPDHFWSNLSEEERFNGEKTISNGKKARPERDIKDLSVYPD